MEEIADIRNVENVCRLCLSTEEPRSSVFADRTSAVSLATKIQTFLSVEILAGDKLSTSVCGECLTRVNKWHAFKESCLRYQEKQRACIAEGTESVPQLVTVKTEPMDFDEPAGSLETVPLTSDDEWDSLADEPNASSTNVAVCSRVENPISPKMSLAIKREVLEDERSPKNAEIESNRGTELLLNPMAVATGKDDRSAEAGTAQKLFNPTSQRGKKKKGRRGPITHYRGIRRFKQRCDVCQIYLHSKLTYNRHIERFHSGKTSEIAVKASKKWIDHLETKNTVNQIDHETVEDIEEMIEDVEDELISLEKDAPLTPVQQNIISQLKTFSCYSCQLSFHDRRSTLNHIRHHMPDLRPYTCIACLTEFADRSIYKLHCGASFQCAMKIALVVPEHGTEKYFTCNMCLRPLSSRRELLSHLSKHSDKQYEQLIAEPLRSPPKLKPMATPAKTKHHEQANRIPVPFMKGNPVHNNICKFCGMIYKHKPNLLKHIEHCKKLSDDERVCHRCVQCGATFLAMNKFQSHLKLVHKRRDIVCSHCWVSFKETASYLEHVRQLRPRDFRAADLPARVKERPGKSRSFDLEARDSKDFVNLNRWSCALCPGSTFPTRAQLAIHRRVHVKLRVYSCTVCRRRFGRHELDASNIAANTSQPDPSKLDASFDGANSSFRSIKSDPGADSAECHACGKVFASFPSLRRHVQNAHETPGRFGCLTCSRNFKTEQDWVEHVEREHKRLEGSTCCPNCTETSDDPAEPSDAINGLDYEDPLACYICGKKFKTEKSLQIHRGHHSRVNNKLSLLKSPKKRIPIEDDDDPITVLPPPPPLTRLYPVKSPTARKTFASASPAKNSPSILQCQVCDDRFNDVANLRKHLWDVHCARNKPEKVFTSVKLQCELCTNVLPDEESLRSHMNWHKSNPILGSKVPKTEILQECTECGKCYSSITSLKRHQKGHEIRNLAMKMKMKKHPRNGRWGGNGFTCPICQKVFATNATLNKHRIASHHEAEAKQPRETQLINPVRPELDFDTLVDQASVSYEEQTKKQPVTCNLCRKILPSKQDLNSHLVVVHRILKTDTEDYGVSPSASAVPCTICAKVFTNTQNMRRHYTKAHTNRVAKYRCTFGGCNLAFSTYVGQKNHERTHDNVAVNCPLCSRRVLNQASLTEHLDKVHKMNYPMNNGKSVNATNATKSKRDYFVFEGSIGLQCTLCTITYPNYRALKIHYFKIHQDVTL